MKLYFYRILIRQSIMLSEETFPSDLQIQSDDDEEFESNNLKSGVTQSLVEFNSYLSSENFNGTNDFNHSIINSMEVDRLIKSSDFDIMTQSIHFDEIQATSFKSIDVSKQLNKVPPPHAPIKKKKSYSCHDLQLKRNNYDHVESKVKKLIENLAEDRSRKTLLRHKSMPVCSMAQTTIIDEKSIENSDVNDLKRELRRKSIKIYELEEKCELKDTKIYELECEKSKMKMTFDELRLEMQKLKEIEQQYKHLKAISSPNRTHRSVFIQTEDSGFNDSSRMFLLQESNDRPKYRNDHLYPQHPAIRHLTFNGENSNTFNQSQFSEINNNTSSDNLIPEQNDLLLDDIDDSRINGEKINEDQVDATNKKKSKKKFAGFFKFVSCISNK